MKQGLYTNEFGTQFWYLNNQLHREDGPAIITLNKTKFWYQYGKRHRTDGPAVESTKNKEWWITDKFISYTETEFENYLIQRNLNHIL